MEEIDEYEPTMFHAPTGQSSPAAPRPASVPSAASQPSDVPTGTKLKILLGGIEDGMGQLIAKHLKEKGYYIRAWSRNINLVSPLGRSFVNEIVEEGNIKDDVCEGIDLVITAIGVRSLESAYLPREQEYQSNMLILKAAMASSTVKHFFLVSGINADKIRKEVPHWDMREKVVDALTEYSRYGSNSMKWTVVRASVFFHDLAEILDMVQRGDRFVPGDGTLEMTPVHAHDFCTFLMKLVEEPPAAHEVQVGGQERFMLKEVYLLAIRVSRRNQSVTTPCPIVMPENKVSKVLDKVSSLSTFAFGKRDPNELTFVPGWVIGMGKMAVSQHAGILLSSMRALGDHKLSAVSSNLVGHRRLEDFFHSIYNGRTSRRHPGFIENVIHSGSFFEYVVMIPQEAVGQTIEWEFGTDEYDIMFGYFYGSADNAPKTAIRNLVRCDSHLNTVKGELVTDKPGVYIFRWDNTFSALRKKILHYKVTKR